MLRLDYDRVTDSDVDPCPALAGPPGQVAAVAGKKAGMKQGELGGILKELGYTEDQVGQADRSPPSATKLTCPYPGLQILV